MIKLISIQADGFKNLKIPRLEFPPEGNILVVGRNESGKSSLFEAVFFALTGSLLVKKGKGFFDALAFKKNQAIVSLEFQKKGIRAVIERTIVRKGQKNTAVEVSFTIFAGDKEQVFNERNSTRSDVEEKIKDFLGFDGDILKNSCFVQQKELDGFIDTPRQDKIKIINKLLNLENFSKLRKKYDESSKGFAPVAEFLVNEFRADEIVIDEKRVENTIGILNKTFIQVGKVDQLKKRLENFDLKAIKASIARLNADLQIKQKEKAALDAQRVDLEAIETKIALWQKDQDASKNLASKIKQRKSERETNAAKLQSIEADITRLEANKKELEAIKTKLTELYGTSKNYKAWGETIKKYKTLEKDLHSIKISIDRLKTQRDEKIQRLIQNEIGINEQVLKITKQYKQNAAQFLKDVGEKTNLEQRRNAAEIAYTRARTAHAIENDIALLKQRRETEERKLAGIKAKIENVEKILADIEAATNSINDLDLAIENIDKDIVMERKKEQIRIEYERLEIAKQDLSKDLDAMQSSVDSLTVEIDAASASMGDGTGEHVSIDQKRKDLEAHRTKAHELESTIQNAIMYQLVAEKQIHEHLLARIKGGNNDGTVSMAMLFKLIVIASIGMAALGVILGIALQPGYFALLAGTGAAITFAFLMKSGKIPFLKGGADNEAIEDLAFHIEHGPHMDAKFLTKDMVSRGKVSQIEDLVQNQIAKLQDVISRSSTTDGTPIVEGSYANSYFFDTKQSYSYDLAGIITKAKVDLQETRAALMTTQEDVAKAEKVVENNAAIHDRVKHASLMREERLQEISGLKGRISALDKSIRDMRDVPTSPVKSISEAIRVLEQRKVEHSTDVRGFKKNISALQGQLKKHNIKSLRDDATTVENEISKLTTQIDQEIRKKDANSTDTEETRTVEELEQERNELLTQLSGIDTRLKATKKLLQDTCTGLNIPLQETSEATLESISQGAIGSIQATHEKQMAQLTRGNSSIETKFNAYATRYPYKAITSDVTKLTSLQSEILKLNRDIENQEEQSRKISEDGEEIAKQIPERFRAEPDSFNKEHGEHLATIEGLQTNLARLQAKTKLLDMDELVRGKGALEARIKQLDDEIELLEQQLKSLEGNINTQAKAIPLQYSRSFDTITKNLGNIRAKLRDAEVRLGEISTGLTNDAKNAKEFIKAVRKDIEPFAELARYKALMDANKQGDIDGAAKLVSELQADVNKLENNEITKAIVPIKADLEKQGLESVIHDLDLATGLSKMIARMNEKKGQFSNEREAIEKQNYALLTDKKIRTRIDEFKGTHSGKPPSELKEAAIGQLAVYTKALEIVELAQGRIQQMVLPKTLENLTRILPILTADKYKDVDISEDYAVKVFDSKLGDYVEKTLFSGGTNDQIALGMRLAFAMATITKDNTNESFIFLDEPLGFFDDERKNCLIDFLTRGEIADIFAQRFVISNFSNIRNFFDHVIELEDGRVISQIRTGSIETLQGTAKLPGIKEMTCFSLAQSCDSDEDGNCEVACTLERTTTDEISSVELVPVNNDRIAITPRVLHFNIGGTYGKKPFTISFQRDHVDDEMLHVVAIIYDAANEKIGTQPLNIPITT